MGLLLLGNALGLCADSIFAPLGRGCCSRDMEGVAFAAALAVCHEGVVVVVCNVKGEDLTFVDERLQLLG